MNRVSGKDNTLLDCQDLIWLAEDLIEDFQPKETGTFTKDNSIQNLNLILYGPPGTGKTFITKKMAVARLFDHEEIQTVSIDEGSKSGSKSESFTKPELITEIKNTFETANTVWRISSNGNLEVLISWILGGAIGIGHWYKSYADLAKKTKEEIFETYGDQGPNAPGRQLYSFAHEAKVGDIIVVYFDKAIRTLGVITSDFIHEKKGVYKFIMENYSETELIKILEDEGYNSSVFIQSLKENEVGFEHLRRVDYIYQNLQGIKVEQFPELYGVLKKNSTFYAINKFRFMIRDLILKDVENNYEVTEDE